MLLNVFIKDKMLIAIGLSVFAVLLVWKHGLKTSIITDAYKYVIMLICAVVLLANVKGEKILVGFLLNQVGICLNPLVQLRL